MLHYFSELKYKQDNNLMQALELSKDCLCNDNELPVRVEAAIALQMLVTQHEKGQYKFCCINVMRFYEF